MANGLSPAEILNLTSQNLAIGSPIQALRQGQQTENLLQQQALQNQLLGQQVAQAPLRQQLLEQQAQAGELGLEQTRLEISNQQRDRALSQAFRASQVIKPFIEAGDLVGAASQVRALERVGLDSELIQDIDDAIAIGDIDAINQQISSIESAIPDTPGTAAQRTFEALTAGFTDEEKEQARRIKAGLAPRAVGTGAITAATTEGLTERLAESEATIKQRTKFAEKTGESRAKAIDSGFDRIQKIDTNVRNIDRAIRAIDEGASTGAIESRFFPSFRRATKELEQVQRELGLDVIGATTFGALSEGELNLALETALPTGLEPDALREFLANKREAQQKLRTYYQNQIDFLDRGGTIAGFLRDRERVSGEVTVETPQGAVNVQGQEQEIAPGVTAFETEETVIPTRFVFNPATGQIEPK